MRPRTRELVPALILPAVAAAVFSPLLLDPDLLMVDGERPILDHASPQAARAIGNDLTFVFLPRYEYVVGRLREGHRVPFWDRSGFGGRSLVGNPQAGLFYPPTWAAWWARRPSALGWLTVGHVLWAGLGAYVLLRSLGVSPPSAAIAGACFEVSPYLIAHVNEGHYPHVWSVSWYPWAVWAFLLARRGKTAGLLALPPALALCFLTGHPQEWYLLVVTLTVWTAADAARLARSGECRPAVGRLALWFGLLAASVAFCAVELLPQFAAQPWLLRRSTIPLRMISRYYLHATNLFQLVNPFALGRPHDYVGHDNYWETVFSVGLVPLILAAVGAARHRDRLLSRYWLGLIAVCVVFACGRKLGLYTLAYRVLPGMDKFRVPARSLFLASLGASVLVGFGLDVVVGASIEPRDWEKVSGRARRLLVGLGTVLLATHTLHRAIVPGALGGLDPSLFTTGGGSVSRHVPEELREWFALVATSGSALVWFSIVGAWAVFAADRAGWLSRRRAGLCLGALAVFELTVSAQSVIVWTPASRFETATGVASAVRSDPESAEGPRRVAAVPVLFPDLTAMRAGVEKTNVNDGFQIQHAADLYEQLYPYLGETVCERRVEGPMDDVVAQFKAGLARGVLDLLGVGYVVADRPHPQLGLEEVGAHPAEGGVRLLKNPTPLPRAYVVPRAVTARQRRVPVAVTLNQIEPREAVLLRRDPLPPGDRQPFTPAAWSSDDPDRVVVRVATRAPGLLVVGNTWMPGWSARVDGRDEPVLRGNGCQQVVPLRAGGDHEVELRYVPPGLFAGAAISLVSVAGFAATGLAVAARRYRVRRAAPGTPILKAIIGTALPAHRITLRGWCVRAGR
jgi:hypothetical protein